MTDQLEDVFAQFRADTLPRVRPPGTADARHTVHRRRVARTVTGTGLLALVVVTAALVLPQWRVLTTPALSPAEQLRRGADAAAALTAAVGQPPIQASGPLPGAGVDQTVVVAAGRYLLYFACVGSGSLQVQADYHPSGTGAAPTTAGQSIDCGDRAQPTSLVLDAGDSGALVTTFAVFGASVGRFGFAYEWVNATDTEGTVTLESAANQTKAFAVLGAAGLIATTLDDRGFISIGDDGHPAGTYQLNFACAGPGSYRLLVQTPDLTGTIWDHSYECWADGRISTVTLRLTKKGGWAIGATPDAAAFDRAGWAYALKPVG
jgi:hypothetical protein